MLLFFQFRLKCLLCVSSRLSPDHVEFIAQVTPEVREGVESGGHRERGGVW